WPRDWSSDVCSSDLDRRTRLLDDAGHVAPRVGDDHAEPLVVLHLLGPDDAIGIHPVDERQVGFEHRVHEDDEHRGVHVGTRQVDGARGAVQLLLLDELRWNVVMLEDVSLEHYDVPAKFVEQKKLDGTAGAINLARPYVDSPVLIIFVDTVFEADLTLINRVDADGIIWAKEVEDYQRFGVIVTDAGGYMTRIVEKPSTPVSRLANIGLQYIKDWKSLFDGIAHTLAQPPGKGGEYYLTDAFQYMVDRGRRLLTAPVAGWYDCGKVDTLLETNQHLLEHGRARAPSGPCPRCTIVPPV